jgi:hypothetical protein
MRAAVVAALALFGIAAAVAQSWPPLPASGFISGRPATDQDVAAGNAVFVLKAYGSFFGKPLDIVVPQYAYLTKAGKRIPVFVVQAELGKGRKLFGVRAFNGEKWVARDYEIQLLGLSPPH